MHPIKSLDFTALDKMMFDSKKTDFVFPYFMKTNVCCAKH